MTPKLTEVQIAAWAGMVRYVELTLAGIDRELAAAGVPSLSMYDILYAVYSSPDKQVRFCNLHAGLILSKSAASRSVSALIRSGDLRGLKMKDDKRGLLLTLTAQGLRSLRSTWKLYGPAIRTHFAGRLAPADLEQLLCVLAKLSPRDPSPRPAAGHRTRENNFTL